MSLDTLSGICFLAAETIGLVLLATRPTPEPVPLAKVEEDTIILGVVVPPPAAREPAPADRARNYWAAQAWAVARQREDDRRRIASAPAWVRPLLSCAPATVTALLEVDRALTAAGRLA